MKKILISLILSGAFLSSPVYSKELNGVKYESIINNSGKKLKFIGAGTRVKWFFNVYTLGAYSESGNCNKNKLVESEEHKSLILVMLREVEGKQMSSTIGEAFSQQLDEKSPKDLKEKREKFEDFFKDKLVKGDKLQFDYVPDKGLSVTQNGKSIGSIEGNEFAKVFFKIYFSNKTCCPELQKEMVGDCSSK